MGTKTTTLAVREWARIERAARAATESRVEAAIAAALGVHYPEASDAEIEGMVVDACSGSGDAVENLTATIAGCDDEREAALAVMLELVAEGA